MCAAGVLAEAVELAVVRHVSRDRRLRTTRRPERRSARQQVERYGWMGLRIEGARAVDETRKR